MSSTKVENIHGVTRALRLIALPLIIALLLIPLAAVDSYSANSVEDYIAEGDDHYARRAEGHNGDWAPTGPIEKALDAYYKAYELGDRSPELAAKILQASYFYATYAEKDRDKQKRVLQRAIDTGNEVISRYPNSVALNYQMGGCWGRWGEVNGIFASARKGVADKVKLYAEKTIGIDPYFAEGGGYRTLGRLHFKAPYIPFVLSWPDKKESLKYLRKAVEAGPENLTNHLFYAETLFSEGMYEEALNEVDHVLEADVDESKVVEDLRDKKEAVALKERILAKYRK